MCYLDSRNASLAALDLSTRLAAAGRTRVDPGDVLDHLEAWEPGTLPAAVRLAGASFTVLTSANVSPSTRRLLSAYSTHGVAYHVMECADAE